MGSRARLPAFAVAPASCKASSFEWFVIARALTGLGYGFAWVGIRALVTGYRTGRDDRSARLCGAIALGVADYEDCPNAINIGNLHHRV